MADAESPGAIKAGDVIAGRYEVRGVVGRGGMGRIYRVFDKTLGEEVALKTLLPDHTGDKVILDRFFNEAKIARSLSHPSIVRVHDIGRAGGIVYISMELLKGKSLRQMLDQVPPGQRLPIAGILRMFDALCAALDYAHRFTVHRDIKPENVMILENGSVKLMDFGISKLMGNPNMTSASIVMGTPHYMSPEQMKNTAKVDARADIYSVGVMLYEALTGDRPTGLAKPASKIHGEVPAALDPIIEKCCQGDPAKRYQTAAELRAALREVRIAVERKTGSGGDSQPAQPRTARGGTAAALRVAMAAVLLLAIAGGAVAGLGWAETRRRALMSESAAEIGGPPAVAASSDSAAVQFQRLEVEVKRLQRLAETAAVDYSESQRMELIDPIIAIGAALWTQASATASTDPARADELGWDAAACYLAPILWASQPDMVFIPPASDGSARAFFIDARPVSAEAYARFRESAKWRDVPGGGASGDAPVAEVSFYDAMAFVASEKPAERLPTTQEYDRALTTLRDSDSRRIWMLGTTPKSANNNAETEKSKTDDTPSKDDALPTRIAMPWFFIPDTPADKEWGEWTSTGADQAKAEDVAFGDLFLTWGGRWTSEENFEPGLTEPVPIENGRVDIGFRGVLDLPRDFKTLAALR